MQTQKWPEMKAQILEYQNFQVKIEFSKTWNKWRGLHRVIHPKTREPLQKWGNDFDSLWNASRDELLCQYYKEFGTPLTF